MTNSPENSNQKLNQGLEAYAMLYDDGSMVFQRGSEPEAGKTLVDNWTGFETAWNIPWNDNRADVISVSFKDEIRPVDCFCWFEDMENCTNMDLGKLDTSDVMNMSWMFSRCSGLTSLDLSSFNTPNVTDMYGMFYNCSGLTTLDLSSFTTPNVTDMSWMFYSCSGLTSLDLSGFDTSTATNTICMFKGCSRLTSLDLSGFNISSVAEVCNMFDDFSWLTFLDLNGFDPSTLPSFHSHVSKSSITKMEDIAQEAIGDQPINTVPDMKLER